jgi:hypothetical protein
MVNMLGGGTGKRRLRSTIAAQAFERASRLGNVRKQHGICVLPHTNDITVVIDRLRTMTHSLREARTLEPPHDGQRSDVPHRWRG